VRNSWAIVLVSEWTVQHYQSQKNCNLLIFRASEKYCIVSIWGGVQSLLLILFEKGEAFVDAGETEGVAAVWQKNGNFGKVIVELSAQRALDFFHVHFKIK